MNVDDKIILPDSPGAATYRDDIRGWVSRCGTFCGDGPSGEQTARYRSCTHVPCVRCGTPTPKGYTCCDACRKQAEIERYEAMPRAEWDGEAMLYSQLTGDFYAGIVEAEEAADEMDGSPTLSDMRLVVCQPVGVRRLDIADVLDGLLSEDNDPPADTIAAIQAAIDAYNAAVAGFVLSWEPGKTALQLGDAP